MTISSTLNVNKYIADGVNLVYPYQYLIQNNDQMVVLLAGIVQSTSYTVSGAGNSSGGNVTFNLPPDSGVEIVLQREVPATQLTDYEEYDPFPADATEDALDKLTMVDQDTQEELGRSLKTPVGEPSPPTLVLGDNPEGKVLEVNSLGTEINAVTSATDLANAATAATDAADAAAASASSANTSEGFAHQWATNPEDNLVNDGTNPEDYSSYHYSQKAAELVALGVVVETGNVAGTGALLTDFNAMDWTGNPYSGTPSTAFGIGVNAIAYFEHDGDTYVWYGPRDVNVGLGGDYTAMADDLVLRSASNALAISFDPNNSSLTKTNVQEALDEASGNTDTNATAITALEGQQFGYNVLINGDFRVNQRGASIDWTTIAIGNFGADRWRKTDATDIQQIVEEGNYLSSTEYTLSGGGVTEAQITSPASGNWTIQIPFAGVTWVQLEAGGVATNRAVRNIQQELAMCQRYYFRKTRAGGSNYYSNTALNDLAGFTISFPVTMRVGPTVNAVSAASFTNCSFFIAYVTDSSYRLNVSTLTDGWYNAWGGTYEFDAEL